MPYSKTMTAKEGYEARPTNTPVLTVHATYATGDYVGTSGVAMEFTGCAAVAGGGGWILGATIIDAQASSVAGELWLFSAAITPPADSAAWSISDADATTILAIIPFGVSGTSDYYSATLNSVSQGQPQGGAKRYILPDGATSIYGCFVTRGAPTYASGSLTFKLSLLQ